MEGDLAVVWAGAQTPVVPRRVDGADDGRGSRGEGGSGGGEEGYQIVRGEGRVG